MRITRYLLITLLLGVGILPLWSQPPAIDPNKKRMAAQRTGETLTIDGQLNEAAWLTAEPATGLIQLEPNPGQSATRRSEIRILYDNSGIYVGARLFDEPDSILMELSERDELGNTDWFGIFLDPYRDGINGVGFIVTPANVQYDAKYSAFGEDDNWDAVWESQTSLNSEGWVAEIKIPFSAIRFPKSDEQTWHVNFARLIQREQQKSFWNRIDPQQQGLLNQSGYLTGIREVRSPVRLQATPFLAFYGEMHHDAAEDPVNSWGRSINGGMDIKYGINDAFTLDMTLIPDFGEARSDNQVLNLSPFEVQFDENRPFFTEGTELFNKGGLFYSRRVGGRPLRYWEVEDQLAEDEEIVFNPVQTQLYNATKISGRTRKGLGVGFFNATSGRETARIRNSEGLEREFETSPLTNYNVLVFDQNLPHNSFATLVNTSVLRSGDTYDANVTGAVFTLRNKANSYALEGKGVLSQQYFADETDLGHTYGLELNKTSGNWLFGLGYNEESNTYDPNDLGFIFNNNERSVKFWMEYNIYEPFWKFNRAGIGLWNRYAQLYQPAVFNDYGMEFWMWAQTKNFWHLNLWGGSEPFVTYDYFEPRTEGRYYRYPTSNRIGFNIRTDSRKQLRFFLRGNHRVWSEEGRNLLSLSFGPRFRVSDKLSFNAEIERSVVRDDIGFVDNHTVEYFNGGPDPVEREDIIFGRRDRVVLENFLGASYKFNANMVLNFRMRHYWSKVEYSRYHRLLEAGGIGETDYDEYNDTNFNAFNIDMIYRWRFAPGSDIFIIWKNSILHSEDTPADNYFRNIDGLFRNAPQTNSLSVKVVYFLDYVNFVKQES